MKTFVAVALSASIVSADSFTGERGNTLTDLVASSYVKIRASMSDKRVTINVEQNIKTSAELSSSEVGEMFICFARKTTGSDECIVTSWVATNPSDGTYTVTNSSYSKTKAKPNASDFTTDKSFLTGTKGFGAGADYILKYS